MLRRLRGLVGLGVFSAVFWTAVGLVIAGVTYAIDPGDFGPGESPLVIVYYFGRAGFVAGVVAGIALAAAERRRTLNALTFGRVTTWGALGGLVLPFIAVAPLPMLPLFAVMGGLTGAAALGLARRGERMALRSSDEAPSLSG